MRRSAWLSLSWHSRERRTPCSKSARLCSSARSPCSSLATIPSNASRELSKLLPCGSLSVISFSQGGELQRPVWRQWLLATFSDIRLNLRGNGRQVLNHLVYQALEQHIVLH